MEMGSHTPTFESTSSTTRSPDAGLSWSPPVVLESLAIPEGRIHVVREDLLPGGTKQRAILPYLQDLRKQGIREVVYASPFCGFAQVALAVCGAALNMPVRLFCEKDPAQSGDEKVMHAFSAVAASFGARIHLTDDLSSAHEMSMEYGETRDDCFVVPLGFRDPVYMEHMTKEVRRQFKLIQHLLGQTPKRLWLPVGSGTLARIFSALVPANCQLLCLDVGVLPQQDPRISGLTELPNVILMRTEELFHHRSREIPPVPSNIHYDAKLWAWIKHLGQDGDVWWNVAR